MKTVAATHPIVIVEDRYGGLYAQGRFFALARAADPHEGETRVAFCMARGPFGDDGEAAAFWTAPPDWIAAGETPDEAMANLLIKAPPIGRDGKPLVGVCPFGHGAGQATAAKP